MIPASSLVRGSGEADEATLEMLRLRAKCLSSQAVAARFWMTDVALRVRTNEVRTADLAHPDPTATPAQIAGCYW